MKKRLLIGLLLLSPLLATAQLQRQFPADSATGKLTPLSLTNAKVDDREFRTAPGLRVLTPENQLIPLQNIAPETLVRYRLDLYGQLLTIWILSPNEQK